MHFYRVFARAEIAGDLLVELAGDDAFEHLVFARRERGEARLGPGQLRPHESGHAARSAARST